MSVKQQITTDKAPVMMPGMSSIVHMSCHYFHIYVPIDWVLHAFMPLVGLVLFNNTDNTTYLIASEPVSSHP